MSTNMTKAACAVIGSTVLAGIPAASEAIVIGEIGEGSPGANDSFPGALVPAANMLDTIQGFVTDVDLDFFRYEGLAPNSPFELLVEAGSFNNFDILADARSSGNALIDDDSVPAGDSRVLSGSVPANGILVVGLRAEDEEFGSEGYRITLSARARAVPEPASLALVAAGLVGLGGLHVARRRRAA